MRFKSIAIPEPSKGRSFVGIIDQTKPNESMSLKEIMERFTRNEPLDIGMEVFASDDENPLPVDLEKMADADLVEKAQFIDRLKSVEEAYKKQEKAKAEKDRLEKVDSDRKKDAARIRKAAEKLAKETLAKSA